MRPETGGAGERGGGSRLYSTPEAARIARVTSRQLQYWYRQNVLFPVANRDGGSGNWLRWSEASVYVISVLREVAAAGFRTAVMANVADLLRDVGAVDWWREERLLWIDNNGGAYLDEPGALMVARFDLGLIELETSRRLAAFREEADNDDGA